MISRIFLRCLVCEKPITARVQIGHELEQPVCFPCPSCGIPIRFTLTVDAPNPPQLRCDENCELGEEEGAIANFGVGFLISASKLNEDQYFPSLELRKLVDHKNLPEGSYVETEGGKKLVDTVVALGGLPKAATAWHTLSRAITFHWNEQYDLRDSQLKKFWGDGQSNFGLEETIFRFIMRFTEPSGKKWLAPLGRKLTQAAQRDRAEFLRFVGAYDETMKRSHFEGYKEIFDDYFRSYPEFNQALLYVRREIPFPTDGVATSADFDRTRAFYGDAFEILGSSLDFPAALTNLIDGRSYDQLKNLSLAKFRGLAKASRTQCFSHDVEMSWVAQEYDSTIRNGSHHKWFKLNRSRTEISYRSGGTGALHKMSYSEYLFRCNRIMVRLMLLAAWELLLIEGTGIAL